MVMVITWNGLVLIGQQEETNSKRRAGLWGFLAETLENGETDEKAIHRGACEEAGIRVTVGKCLGQTFTPTPTTVLWYACKAVNPTLFRAGGDLKEVCWQRADRVLARIIASEPGFQDIPDAVIEFLKDCMAHDRGER